jgi:hypothetical protein
MEQLTAKFLAKYHRDPLIACLPDYSDPYSKLQLLHLIADEEDLPAVESLMAEHAANLCLGESRRSSECTREGFIQFWPRGSASTTHR